MKPNIDSNRIGKQCSGERSECPWDTCNTGPCLNGCSTNICTKMGCDERNKNENQLCVLSQHNCKRGLICADQNDGCDNGIGRCIKIGKNHLDDI